MPTTEALYEAVYRSQPEEHALRVSEIDGKIPDDLSGTFLRSGPGLMQVGDDTMAFFDGHALVAGVSFEGGRATFRSRFVKTPLYEQETSQKRMVKRRVFTNLPSRWSNLFALAFGNTAMHDVYAWGEGDQRRVVAANDPGHFAMDARTLATKGREDWGGAVTKGQEMAPMPYEDPHTGRLVGWIKRVGQTRPDELKFVELDGAFRVVKETPMFPLAASPVIVHDQCATKKWYVATEQAFRLSAAKAIWGAVTPYEAFSVPDGATATVLLVRREGEQELVRVPLPSPNVVAFHIVNCFDDGDRVVVDVCTYDDRIHFEAAGSEAFRRRTGAKASHGPLPTPTRFVIDPAAGRVVETKKLGAVPGEAPVVGDGRLGSAYRFAYYPTLHADDAIPDRGGYFYYGAIAKLDAESGETQVWSAPSALVSPVSFVRRSGGTEEDDGYLLAYLLREASAGVVILDARRVADGPIATLDLGVRLPGVSHVRWAEGLLLDA